MLALLGVAYAAWVDRLNRAPEAGQEHVDALYRLRGAARLAPSTTRALEPTTARVLEIVASAGAPMSATSVAEALGASRPTAQRCLTELARQGLIALALAYGTTGRPQHRYRPCGPRATSSSQMRGRR